MKVKGILSGLLAVAMVFSLTACSGIMEPKKNDGKKTVGIAMPTKTLERWNRDGAYLKKKFEDAGYNVELTYSDNKIDQQVKDIESLIADDVNLLLVATIDGESMTQVLRDAKDMGIPVIAYDRLIRESDAIDYYVSFDNYKVGQMQGQFVIDKFGLDLKDKSKSYNIEFTAGDPADNNATYFFNGAYDTLKPYLDAGILKVPSKQTKFDQVATKAWDTATAMTRFQNILGSNYSKGKQLDAVVCSNDATALGVLQAIDSDYAGDNKVLLTGQDADEANLAKIVDGKQTMTIYKTSANEAEVAIDVGKAILNGEKPDADLIKKANWDFSCKYDTKTYDNGKKVVPSYLLTPVVVTKDNLQKELIDTGYYKLDKKGYPKNAN